MAQDFRLKVWCIPFAELASGILGLLVVSYELVDQPTIYCIAVEGKRSLMVYAVAEGVWLFVILHAFNANTGLVRQHIL